MLIKRFLLVSALFGATALAHSEKMTTITGHNVGLRTINHSIAGSVRHRLISGFKINGAFESKVTIIENDQETSSYFKKNGSNILMGTVTLLNGSSFKEHNVSLKSYLSKEEAFVFFFDNVEYKIFVKADSFHNGHFVNPSYSMLYKGKMISFKLEEGSACVGYSAHLIAMIMPLMIF